MVQNVLKYMFSSTTDLLQDAVRRQQQGKKIKEMNANCGLQYKQCLMCTTCFVEYVKQAFQTMLTMNFDALEYQNS